MVKALCPGSFDPFTLGHLDVVEQALAFCSEIVVGIAHNTRKQALFSVEQRREAVISTLDFAGIPRDRVEVVEIPGLLADYCRENQISMLVKGLRSGADYDAEAPAAMVNLRLGDISTVFIPARPEFIHISSSLAKEIAHYRGNLDSLVAPAVAEMLVAATAAQ